MHLLFVHQNFPAQFQHIAPRLARDYGWTCKFATARDDGRTLEGVAKVVYRPWPPAAGTLGRCSGPFETAAGHARGVYEALKRRPDVRPDLVVAHSGFGSSLFLPQLYDCTVINFFEYFFRPVGRDLGYRPETPVTESNLLRSRVRNAMVLLDLDNCDQGRAPSEYQRDLFPQEYQGKIDVAPEGVDTGLYAPGRRSGRRRLPDGTEVPEGVRIVTYASRGFELMRGFDVFMKAASLIARRLQDVLFVVVGGDKVHYGNEGALLGGRTFREYVLGAADYDPRRAAGAA